MKTCNQIREVLAEMLDGGIEEAVRTEVELHMEDCQECANFYKQLKKIKSEFVSMPFMEVSSGFSAGLAAKISKQAEAKIVDFSHGNTHKIKPVWSKLFAYAAGFGFMAICFVALEQQGVFKGDSKLPVLNNQLEISKVESPKPEKSFVMSKNRDTVKASNKSDSLKHLKVVTPNEDKVFRVSSQ